MAIKESCWKHTIKSKQSNVPPLRKEGNKRKSWVIGFGKQIMLTLGWTVLGAKLQDVTALSFWVVSVCHRMYWPLELLNSVQLSFKCTDEILDHNLLSEAVPPPSILSLSWTVIRWKGRFHSGTMYSWKYYIYDCLIKIYLNSSAFPSSIIDKLNLPLSHYNAILLTSVDLL